MMLVNTQNRMSGVIMVTFILMLIENFRNTFFDESVNQNETMEFNHIQIRRMQSLLSLFRQT